MVKWSEKVTDEAWEVMDLKIYPEVDFCQLFHSQHAL